MVLWSLLQLEKDREEFIQQLNPMLEGLTLIRESKYTEGLDKCGETIKVFPNIICHQAALTLMKEKGEKIDPLFCDSIPTTFENNLPLTLQIYSFFENLDRTEIFEKKSLILKEECFAGVTE